MSPNEIRNLRFKLKLTQEDFARLLGLRVATVNRWENGVTKPSPLALMRLKQIQEEGKK